MYAYSTKDFNTSFVSMFSLFPCKDNTDLSVSNLKAAKLHAYISEVFSYYFVTLLDLNHGNNEVYIL